VDDFKRLQEDVERLARDVERVAQMWARVSASLDRCGHDVIDEDVLELAATFRRLCNRLSFGGSIDRSWQALYAPREDIDLTEVDVRYRN
jgi:hypothetical protein